MTESVSTSMESIGAASARRATAWPLSVSAIPTNKIIVHHTAFPNVTVIHIRDVMDKVLVVLRNIGLGIRALGAFTIVAGVVVLGGTIAATQARRAREVALLKTLGMTRRDVIAMFTIEYALTGLAAAVVGLLAGGLLAWAVLTRLMDVPWSLRAGELIVAVVVTVGLAITAGLLASARALAVRPAEALRSD